MPLRKPYSYADARAAIDRSNGQPLALGANDPMTHPRFTSNGNKDTGQRYGHEYMHRGPVKKFNDSGDHPSGLNTSLSRLESNRLGKSRTEHRDATYRLTEYLLNTQKVQSSLGQADMDPPNKQFWLKKIPVTQDVYGYSSDGTVPKKISSASINFRKINGQLFIASVYPDGFLGERDFDLDKLFV
jgi:hypothetical protein